MQALGRTVRAPFGSAACSRGSNPRLAARTTMVARADPPKVVREYREDDDKIVVPGEEGTGNPQDGSLYADQVKSAKPKSNLSPEMKDRLRKEYTGLGGAENTYMGGGFVVAAASTLLQELELDFPSSSTSSVEEPSTSGTAGASTSMSEAQQIQQPQRNGSSKWVIDENELLQSTWEHRAWTGASMALMGLDLAGALQSAAASGPGELAGVAVALLASYVLSDLGTGIYHWAVDNYGSGSTPLVGRQIAAFQGHHQRPWTITQRQFANNVHQVFKPAAFPAAAALAASPLLPDTANAFVSSFLFLICMSQQFHAWSHMKKSELPSLVLAAQDAGILISRKAHGAHHKPNFDGNYCIVSGLWNPLLDSSGFFRALERFVATQTGVEPRCWYPPEHEWQELAQPGKAQ